MDSNKELNCLEALQYEAEHITENGDLDPDVCSWNQRKYPCVKPYILHDKSKSTRPSPKTSPKPTRNLHLEKDINIIQQFQSTSPKGFSGSKQKFYVKKVKTQNFPKISASPEPVTQNRISRESPKIFNYSNYLTNLSMKKVKPKQVIAKKTDIAFNLINCKIIDFLNKMKSPRLEVMKTPTLQNKLPLSNAQTLEELLSSTKLVNINRRYIKFKRV